MKIFKFNLPLYVVIVLVCGAFAGGNYIYKNENNSVVSSQQSSMVCPASMDQIRLKNYEFTHPLILTDVNEESESLNGLQTKISSYINELKTNQKVDQVSVYIRQLNNGARFSINSNETYNPASLIKVAYLITYMKMAENNRVLLSKKLFFSKHYSQANIQNIKDFELKENAYYTIEQLLTAMIMHSDNDATTLLGEAMNMDIFNGLFRDLNIPIPNPVTEYYITVADYCKFFRILYSSTYTRPEFSEYALKLLTYSTFSDGIKKGIDSKTIVAHKFGERIIGNKTQLHEIGIVFNGNTPYLIGVMTKGNSLIQQGEVIAEISRIAFDDFKQKSNS